MNNKQNTDWKELMEMLYEGAYGKLQNTAVKFPREIWKNVENAELTHPQQLMKNLTVWYSKLSFFSHIIFEVSRNNIFCFAIIIFYWFWN